MNNEHLLMLKSSVATWNKWREEHWNIKPDLSGADLRGVNLFKANLDDADLTKADLRGVVMVNSFGRNANFSEARLDGAKLQGSNLGLANFTAASLRRANLIGTVMRGACLIDADLTGTNCTGAKFENSNTLNTLFYDAIVNKANFEHTNIHEAQLYGEQFKNAKLPLEAIATVESKKKVGVAYAKVAITVSIMIIFLFGVYVYIFSAETPGAFNTNLRAAFYSEIGGLFDGIGQKDEAIRYMEMAIDYNPNIAKSYKMLANIYRERKDDITACYYYEIYLEKGADPSEIANYKNYVQMVRGNPEKSIKVDDLRLKTERRRELDRKRRMGITVDVDVKSKTKPGGKQKK